jgi:STAS-like domain of unknown function (DUF4325)
MSMHRTSEPEECRFARGQISLKLATHGIENQISRASARKVLSRIDRFDQALLDFQDVKRVGQAFADEIFRVFANANPHVKLIWINANEEVTPMIRRAEAVRRESGERN